MTQRFEDLPWHDAELLELLIDRKEPGHRDEIFLRVVWPHGEQVSLRFGDCYSMNANLNFGVIAEERIASAQLVFDEDDDLRAIRQKWLQLGVCLEHLRCYRIETASTASVIRIYAKTFEVIAL